MKVTIETILNTFTEWIANKVPIPPSKWIDGAFKLNVLLEVLDDEIVQMETLMNEKEMKLIKKDIPVSRINILKRNAINYGEYLSAIAKKKRIEEFIRLAKKRQTMPDL